VTLQRSEILFGGEVVVRIVDKNEEIGYIHIEEALAEIRRVEKMVASLNPDSKITEINRQAGRKPVSVSQELFRLLQRAIKISELTDGAYDVSAAALDTLWRFDGSMTLIPRAEDVEKVLPLVGYRKLRLNPEDRTVFLPERGMRIDLGRIGKGYAIDRAREFLRSKQVAGGMINAGGDIVVWGKKASGDNWLLGVADPNNIGQILSWIPLVESSVSLLRSDNRYVQHNGVRYGEILNPFSGFPVQVPRQVTVFAASAELSTTLAAALCVLGPEKGLPMIELLGDTEAIVVGDSGFMYWTSGLMLGPE
jgi:thiamine biosynthesis lipoprotein